MSLARADPATVAKRDIGFGRVPPDVVGVLTLLLLTALVSWERLGGGWALQRLDTIVFFLPTYGFLGEQLRSGNIPGWNPYQFSGAPFAGDPESGWMYFPAMLFFTVLPKVAAFKALTAFHLGLAGLSMYALGRVLGMGLFGGIAAGVAFEFGMFTEFTGCCTVYAQASAWLPLSLIGVELAVRSETWLARSAWWSVTGLAISQMLAGWFGQGAYYGLLVVGGYVAYRTLIAPPSAMRNPRARVSGLLVHGVAVLAIGFGLAAAGILPRLDVIENSTLRGGDYRGVAAYVARSAGWSPDLAFSRLLSIEAGRQRYYAGGAVIALAVLAPLIARRRFSVPFFAIISLAAIVLTFNPTVLHRVLYLLPRFQLLHEHHSYRVLIVFYFGVALLAGVTVATLDRSRNRKFVGASAILGLGLLLGGVYRFETARDPIDALTTGAIGVVSALVLLYALVKATWVRRLVPMAIIVVLLVDPLVWTIARDRETHEVLNQQTPGFIDSYAKPAESAQFLLDQREQGPGRFFGYEQSLIVGPRTPERFNGQYRSSRRNTLVLNNRSLYLGLNDIQGYNPVQNARYNGYVEALNEEPQEYHASYVLPGGLDSPLLDLLNVRYMVIPALVPPGRPDLFHMSQRYPTVYTDRYVRILENEAAFPRTWIVHEAVQAAPGEALPLMTSGAVDLRTTAVLETEPPPMEPPTNPAADEVTSALYEPDRIRLTARTDAPGLLMLSEIHDPGWRAYIDGKEVDIHIADHALRAVPVPDGTHEVELRYEPTSLKVGLAITGVTMAIVGGIWGTRGWRSIRKVRHAGS